MKLSLSLILLTTFSQLSYANHFCEGFYETENPKSDCLETIEVKYKKVQYNHKAIIIVSEETTYKEVLSLDDVMSTKTLASDLILSSNQGESTSGNLYFRSGVFRVTILDEDISQETVTKCDQNGIVIETKKINQGFFSSRQEKKICRYKRLN